MLTYTVQGGTTKIIKPSTTHSMGFHNCFLGTHLYSHLRLIGYYWSTHNLNSNLMSI